jgi:hypothetical protein
VGLWLLAVLLIFALMSYLAGNFHGYRTGVRHTEQRWSEAVNRKEFDDRLRGERDDD